MSCGINMVRLQRTFLNGIPNNGFAPTHIPQHSLTHPHTLYCSSLSPFTLAYGHRQGQCLFFRGLITSPIPNMPSLSHTHTYLRHVPSCVFGTASGSCVPSALLPLATGHVTLWEQELASRPPISAEKSDCGCVGRTRSVIRVRWCDEACVCLFEGRRQAGGELVWLPVRAC